MKYRPGALAIRLLAIALALTACSSSGSKPSVTGANLLSSDCKTNLNSRLASCGFRIERIEDDGKYVQLSVATKTRESLATDSLYYYKVAELACQNVAGYLRGTPYCDRVICLTLNCKVGDKGSLHKYGLASYDVKTQSLKWEPAAKNSGS